MKVVLLQIEDRFNNRLQTFMNENKEICLKNGIQYISLKKSYYDVPPYWGKIFEIYKIMNENNEIDYVMWLDSDAFFINYSNNKFHDFLKKYEKYSMIFTEDIPPWEGEFCAGSFIVKNDKIGKDIIKEWISHYHPDKWKYENLKWKTDTQWAGEHYEQGAFIKFILHNDKFVNHIIKLPYYYLNNNNCEHNMNETITVHLAGHYRDDINIVNKFFSLFKYNKNDKFNVIYFVKFISHYLNRIKELNNNLIIIYIILSLFILLFLVLLLIV